MFTTPQNQQICSKQQILIILFHLSIYRRIIRNSSQTVETGKFITTFEKNI